MSIRDYAGYIRGKKLCDNLSERQTHGDEKEK